MAIISRIVKFLATLAALITSVEAIVRLVKFAWNLLLELLKRQALMSGFAAKAVRFGFAR